MSSSFALVDCNSFYASCECVFRPALWDKPVGVLSNNDGCFISRNKALKALGLKMGTPLFQAAELLSKHPVHIFSSNFALYGDMSARVMSLLETYTPHLEIYSIDEAFLDLSGVAVAQHDRIAYSHAIKKHIRRGTGIPVCVGIGPTKTLAKLANFAAKAWEKSGGVVDLTAPQQREKLMRRVPVGEVWGIGAHITAKLQQLGIYTAWDLAQQYPAYIQAQCLVVVARTVLELQGIPCLQDTATPQTKQQLLCSRSFSRRLTHYHELAAALTEFATRVGEKLRQQQGVAGCISVSIRTNRFNPTEPYYQRAASMTLDKPTQDTRISYCRPNACCRKSLNPATSTTNVASN